MTQEVDMTAINTNTAALNAQFFMSKANKEMVSAMTKLSSGKQVNSALQLYFVIQ